MLLSRALSFVVVTGALSLVAACGSSEPSPSSDAGVDRHVVVLFTSDEHSHLFAYSPELDDATPTTAGTGALVGGVTRRAAVLKRERKAASDAGKDTITVSAGDNVMGTLAHVGFETNPIDWQVMRALGYDATTLGNHELDFGPVVLAHAISAAQSGSGAPAIVAANVHFSSTSADDDALEAEWSASPQTPTAMHPYTIVTTASGVRIGILGWMGVQAEHVAPNKTPVKFSSAGLDPSKEGDPSAVLPKLYADVQPVVDTLRSVEKVDLVVALSHAGVEDPSAPETSEDWKIASNVTGIDLFVSGHSHTTDPRPIVVPNAKGTTLVLNGSENGRHVGRVELTLHADGSPPTWDAGSQTLISIDDTIAPDADETTALSTIVQSIETTRVGDRGYLETLLTRSIGTQVNDDPSKSGDLYFHPIGATTFDVTDTNALLALSSDAMLGAADAWAAGTETKTDVAIESAGVIRGVVAKGKTGVISAADAFDIVPLGASPADRSVGYPLVRAYLWQVELRGVFEASIEVGPTNEDFHLGASGIRVEYDATRPAALSLEDLLDPSKGRVMRMTLDTTHDGVDSFDKVIYDRTAGISDDFALVSVVSSSYVAQFASDVGATLKGADGNPTTLAASILHRGDGSEWKQVESFFSWLHAAPGGSLPALYDVHSPLAAKRLVCIAGC